jgi:hypothetical protein
LYIITGGDDQEGIKDLKQHIYNHFHTKDLGRLRYILRIEVSQSQAGIDICLRKYVLISWKKIMDA